MVVTITMDQKWKEEDEKWEENMKLTCLKNENAWLPGRCICSCSLRGCVLVEGTKSCCTVVLCQSHMRHNINNVVLRPGHVIFSHEDHLSLYVWPYHPLLLLHQWRCCFPYGVHLSLVCLISSCLLFASSIQFHVLLFFANSSMLCLDSNHLLPL